jgi:hypothetical protein
MASTVERVVRDFGAHERTVTEGAYHVAVLPVVGGRQALARVEQSRRLLMVGVT